MIKINREDILTRNPVKIIFLLSLPLMISQLLQTLYYMADTFWLGHLPITESGDAIAGVQITWPIIWFFITFSFGFGIAGIALISQYIGSGEDNDANLVANQMLSLSAILGLVIAIFGFFITPYLIPLITTATSVAMTANAYMKLIFFGMPFIFITFAFQGILSAKGDTVTPMYINLVTVTLNIILDPFMIFGWWGLPRMKVIGAALATIICQGFAAFISIYLLFKGTKGIKIYLDRLILKQKWIKKIIKIGLPAAIGQSTTSLGFVIVMAIIGRVQNSETVIAAYGIGDKLISVIFIVIDGLGMGIMTLIGQNLGAKLTDRVKEIAKKGLQIVVLVSLLEAVLVFVLRIILFKVFIPNRPDIAAEGAQFLTIFMWGIPFFALAGVIMSLFRGSGHTLQPMIIDISRLWIIRIPLAYLLSLKLGSTGIWWGITLSNVIAALIALFFYFQGEWKKQVIHEHKETIKPAPFLTE